MIPVKLARCGEFQRHHPLPWITGGIISTRQAVEEEFCGYHKEKQRDEGESRCKRLKQADVRGLFRRLIEVVEKYGNEDWKCRSGWL